MTAVDLEAEGSDADPGVDILATNATAPVVAIDSGSDGGSSSSSSSRSRSRSRNKHLGAAAGAALLTAAAPLDVDECEKVVDQEINFPTPFAMQLQHAGNMVAVMAETGTVIGVSPLETGNCILRISGTSASVKQASWQLEQLHARHIEEERIALREAEANVIENLEFPSDFLNALVGPNGAALVELRERCGGIMIAMQPPTCEGAPMTAFIGPGERANVDRAKEDLVRRLGQARDDSVESAKSESKTGNGVGTSEESPLSESSLPAVAGPPKSLKPD